MADQLRFCHHDGCVYFTREPVNATMPASYPRCKRQAAWKIEVLPRQIATELDDAAFLRRLKITPEW